MAKKKNRKTLSFTFGDPESVLNNNPTDYLGLMFDAGGNYYSPPVDLKGLVNLMGANAFHGPILHFKKDRVMELFQPTRLLKRADMQKFVLDYLATGNAYLQNLKNGFGRLSRLHHLPALPMRRTREADKYIKLISDVETNNIEFKAGEVTHLLEYDPKQSFYGLPEYYGGVQSVLLSEDTTLFRRRLLKNGAHMGYVLVTNDADLDDDTAKAIENAVKESKGLGNGKSLYINIGRSNSREPVQVIPVGNQGTKDDHEKIKGITKGEMLAMHRMQPGLSGIIPENTAGFGDIEKVMMVYYYMEVKSMLATFEILNEYYDEQVVSFKQPDWLVAGE